MTYKFFIDECLSPELAGMAQDAGYQATCSRNQGLLGLKDWELIKVVVDQDYTFVTHNAHDFRGEGTSNPGGLHARQEIHPGLVCLNAHSPLDILRQRRLFAYALDELREREDLINQALEVFEDEHGEVTISTYEIPESDR
jgi:hypothetical protein